MVKKVTYTLDDETVDRIEKLADGLLVSKTQVIRQAVLTLFATSVMAHRNAERMLAELRERYPEKELRVYLPPDADAEHLQLVLQIDGAAVEDVRAFAVFPEPGADHVLVYVEVEMDDFEAALLRQAGVLPRLPVGILPWPPKPVAIVVALSDLELEPRSAETAARLEGVTV